MWNMIGLKEVDVFHWESFGKDWWTDIKKELKVNANEHGVEKYG